MSKNLRKTHVFEGVEAPREGQVGPKMGPSWGKMGSGRELDGIFGHLRRKMAVKFDIRRKMFKNLRKNKVSAFFLNNLKKKSSKKRTAERS